MCGYDDFSNRCRTSAGPCILDSNLIRLKVGLPFSSNNFGVEGDMRSQSVFGYEFFDISMNCRLEFAYVPPVILQIGR